MKKILHLSHTDIRFDSRILKEIGALESAGKFNLLAIGIELSEGATVSKKKLETKLISAKLLSKKLFFLPKSIRYIFNMIELTVRFVLYGLKFKPAAVHCHDTFVLPSGVFIKMMLRCKLVYDAHELESDKNGQTLFLSKATLAIERWAWGRVDLLISVSDSINAWYVEHLGPKTHLLVLNSPEVAKSKSGSVLDASASKYFHYLYGIPLENKIFIYIGMLSNGRGIDLCLQAFASRSINAHVVFMGYGPLWARVNSFSEKYSNIHLHEPVPHESVVEMARNADVGLCFVENISLSDYYSLPNKLFEYAFSGLPVLASNFPEISKVVHQYSLGFCSDVELDSIRKMIIDIVDGDVPVVSKNLDGLSWETQAARLNEAYNCLLRL